MLQKTLIQNETVSHVYIDDVECSICTEIIGTSCNDQIGVLACGHLFCLKCISEYQRFRTVTRENQFIECPKCRQQYRQILNMEACPEDIQLEIKVAVHQAKAELQVRRTKLAQSQAQAQPSPPMIPSVKQTFSFRVPRPPLGPPGSDFSPMMPPASSPMYAPMSSPMSGPVRSPIASSPMFSQERSVQQSAAFDTREAPQFGRALKEEKHRFWQHHYCERCHSSFGMIGMRYHCRVCRRVICISCSRTHPLHNIAQHGLSNRVCRDCFV